MVGSVASLLGRVLVPGAVAAAVALPLSLPSQAHAWWRGGVWVTVPPVVVGPPAYYAPPPVYTAPYPAYGYPHQVWIPGHWRGGYWIPGHWVRSFS